MKAVLVPTALVFAVAGFVLSPNPASAKGCIKGAIVGGVAGHYAGHHGLLGAAGGCIVGHYLAKKHAEEERARERAYEQQRCANPSPGSPVLWQRHTARCLPYLAPFHTPLQHTE